MNSEMLQLLNELNLSQDQIDRFKRGEKPGAIWHIFKPDDADKIRDYLWAYERKRSKKSEEKLTQSDRIHDQRFYIDKKMLKELEDPTKEFKVKPFTILQFLGDAIFIPAGAPHQVFFL